MIAMSSLSVEEENYVRMSLLLTGLSPRAVRALFDKEFPPTYLPSTLNQKYNTLLSLQKSKVINQAQWNLLFPPRSGVADSKTFDVTLMICLIRNLTSVTPPALGFDCLPSTGETTPGADLARIKYYRNYLAHLDENKIDNSDFTMAWNDISDAIGRLGGASLYQESKDLKTKILDQSNLEIMLEVQNLKWSHSCLRDNINTNHTLAISKKIEEFINKLTDAVPWDIRERLQFNLKADSDQFTTIVPDKYQKMYIERMLDYWSKGEVVTVFTNNNMKIPEFRDIFLMYLKSLDITYQKQLATKYDNAVAREILKIFDYESMQAKERMNTPLLHCCTLGDTNMVQWCCSNGADVNYCRNDGESPLYIACKRGYTDIVTKLVDNKADINKRTWRGKSPLYIACKGGYTDIVTKLVDNKADINKCTWDGESPLYIACKGGYTDIVTKLVDNKADINKRTRRGKSPLYIACNGGYTDIVTKLLDKADIYKEFIIKKPHLVKDDIDILEIRNTKSSVTMQHTGINLTKEHFEFKKKLVEKTEFESLYMIYTGRKETIGNMEMLITAVSKQQSMVCRWLLANLIFSSEILEAALTLTSGISNSDTAKAICCHCTKLFCKENINHLKKATNIWPGYRGKQNEICLVVESSAKIYKLPKKFMSFAIINASTENYGVPQYEEVACLDKITPKNLNCMEGNVSGQEAEQLFSNHRNLVMITSSFFKSTGFNASHQVKPISCIHLYCSVKGIIPVGETHFPKTINDLQTDVFEGHPQLSTQLCLGNTVGSINSRGTLGGFYNYLGLKCFLTCAHVMVDLNTLLSPPKDLKVDSEIAVFVYTPAGYTHCGKVIRIIFNHDQSDKTSIDAALVLVDSDATIDPNNMVLLKDISWNDLGMKSEYVNQNVVNPRKMCSGKSATVLAEGANTQSKVYCQFNPQTYADVDYSNKDLYTVTANGKIFHPLLIAKDAHLQLYSNSSQTRILRLYNQMVIDLKTVQGDSGTCIFIKNSKYEGCIGMSVASCGGLTVVTPMKDIVKALSKFT